MIKFTIKTLIAAAAVCAFTAPAFAYTLSGTIQSGKKLVIQLQKPIPQNFIKLTLTAPPVNAGVRYLITLCVGTAPNPCPLPLYVVEGQQLIATFGPGALSGVITLGQGTRVSVPYVLDVDLTP